MKEFEDKVSVITGAASGIGFGIAEKCAREGMKVVLADIEVSALENVESMLKAIGAETLAVPTDVSNGKEVEALADTTYDTFGEVNLLFNNAGVNVVGQLWECTEADWQWVLGVNLWGVIHGIRVFVPRMLEQQVDGYIVNTASGAGLLSGPYMGIYQVTKHGVVTLSETLYHELNLIESKIKVSVLCPGYVKTRIMDAERNRPSRVVNVEEGVMSKGAQELREELDTGVETGMSPSTLADIVFDAIRKEKFYILPGTLPEYETSIRTRMEEILQERNPALLEELLK